MWEIVGGVVRYRDLVAKIKIEKFFFPACLLVIRENFPLYGIMLLQIAKRLVFN